MAKFTAKVKKAFGIDYLLGNELNVISAVDYPGYYWILHPITGKKTTDLVDTSLLGDLTEVDRAA